MTEPTEEIQELLNFLLPFAERMLAEHGEFYPYAAAMASDGEVSAVAAGAAEEQPDVGELLVELHAVLRAQAAEGSIRASGIAADVSLTDPDTGVTTDAVQVELDHAEGEAVDIYVPYERAGEDVRFGELVSAQGREPVFSASASPNGSSNE
jgi:hypothetical protein